MGVIADLIGTLRPSFRIGRATLDTGSLTAPRGYALPDKAGTIALTSDATAGTPYSIGSGVVFSVQGGTQTLYDEEIDVDGEIELDGLLSEVN